MRLGRRARTSSEAAPTAPESPGELAAWRSIYGSFLLDDEMTAEAITGLDKESGKIHRFIVEFVERRRQSTALGTVLLPGEYRRVKHAYVELLGVGADEITTTGLGGDVDVDWDFEDPPPPILAGYSLILSQAMLEHLIDPYKHLRDLYSMLAEGGSLIVLTVLPTFPYHRYPVDCLRFFPDWFEEVAQRVGAIVTTRYVGDHRIVYEFAKGPTAA